MEQSFPKTSLVVTGRFGEPPTLKIQKPELPFLRFLEQPKAYYPGVELIVDAELSSDNDPYLNDHIYQGERIFPGVIGLEAMAQVAMALAETSEIPIFENIHFHRPVVVSESSPLKIRIAALLQESGKIEIALRSEQTGFTVDHFRATCTPPSSLDNPSPPQTTHLFPSVFICEQKQHPIHPQQDLYNNILFHQGRFQRLQNYRHLQATECVAEIETKPLALWFSRYLPQDLILGDPGARDAVIHALQACIPQATILPTGIERLTIYSVNLSDNQFVSAKERAYRPSL
jgi:enediyne polyketide synthase